MTDFNKCDVCGIEAANVKAGRWIFYCPKHRAVDIKHTMDNEVLPDLQSGNMSYINADGELQDAILDNLV